MEIMICIKYTQPTVGDSSLLYSNPYDLYAIHNIVALKQRSEKNISITSICMASDVAQGMLRNTIAMGCDNTYLISDSAFAGSDTLATSYILSRAIRYISLPTLICCGKKSIDGETGFVASALAYRLGYFFVAEVKNIISISEKSVSIEVEVDSNILEMEVMLPALLCFKGVNIKASPLSLKSKKKARSYMVNTISNKQLQLDRNRIGLNGSRTDIVRLSDVVNQNPKKSEVMNLDYGIEMLTKKLNNIVNKEMVLK